MKARASAISLIASMLFPLIVRAEANDTVAIQRKKYVMAHELRLSIGTLPVDPFEKGYSASLSYSIHWDYVAWEVFQVTGAVLMVDTDLKKELIGTFAIPPEDFAAPRYIATTGVELTPFYGKMAIFNDTVVHQALLVGLYGGVIVGHRPSIADSLKDVRPAVGLGLGWRFFVDETISLRIDARDYVDFRRAIRANEKFDVENVFLATLSFSLNMGRDDG